MRQNEDGLNEAPNDVPAKRTRTNVTTESPLRSSICFFCNEVGSFSSDAKKNEKSSTFLHRVTTMNRDRNIRECAIQMGDTSKNNTSEVWRIIKSLLSSSRSNISLPHKLKHNNTFTTNPTLIANSFNDYFSGIGKTLADQLKPSSESEHTKYLKKRLHQSLFLTPTTSFDVFNLISGLKNTKSNGKDNISA